MITKEDIARGFESAHPIAGDTEKLMACIEQLQKERDAYREVAIEVYCTDNNGVRKSWDKEVEVQVDAKAKRIMEQD